MTQVALADTVKDLADLGVAGLTIFAALWGGIRYANRPKLFVGVPPTRGEARAKGLRARSVGGPAVAGAFVHRSPTLARRLRWGYHKQRVGAVERRWLQRPSRCRTVARSNDGLIGFPIVFVNRGGRMAQQYTGNVAVFDEHHRPGVHLVQVFTEGLEFGFYAAEPDRVAQETNERAMSVTPRPIREDYRRYMGEGVGEYGDWLFVWGALDAGSYEVVHLDFEVDTAIDSFYLVFFLDSADAWVRAKHFIQRIDIAPAAAATAGWPPPTDIAARDSAQLELFDMPEPRAARAADR